MLKTRKIRNRHNIYFAMFSIMLFLVAGIGMSAKEAKAAPDNGPRAEIVNIKVKNSGKKAILTFYDAGNATYTLQRATSERTVTKKRRVDILTHGFASTYVEESWKTMLKTEKTKITIKVKPNKAYRFRIKVKVHGGMSYKSIPVDIYTGKVSVFTKQDCDKYNVTVYGSSKYTKYRLRGFKQSKIMSDDVERRTSQTKKGKSGIVTFTIEQFDFEECIGKWQIEAYTGSKKRGKSLKFKLISRRMNATNTKGTKLDKRAVYYMNKYRREHGLKDVKWSKRLEYGTRLLARDQSTFFGHLRPEGEFDANALLYMLDPMIKNEYYCGSFYLKGTTKITTGGSNLFAGGTDDPEYVFKEWMDSEGHRATILDDEVTEICYASYTWSGKTAVVLQVFGYPKF